MIDPVKGLAELVEKWRANAARWNSDPKYQEMQRPVLEIAHANVMQCAYDLAVAIPEVEAAIKKADSRTATFCGEVVSLRAELAALREPMACGHPKACQIPDQRTDQCDGMRHALGYSLCPGCIQAHCTVCAREQDRIRLAEAAALERIAGVCDFVANGTIEAMSELGRSETWKIIAQNSVEQYRSIAAKARILISHPLLEEHNAEVRDLALEEAAICAKRCETWYEGHGDATASHAADEIRALKGPKQ